VSDPGAAELDACDLPPTQALVLEILAARHRLGETWRTFSTRHLTALRALEKRGLVGLMRGTAPHTCRAYLTDAGRKAALSEAYEGPHAFTREALTDALTRLEVKVQLTGPIAGMVNAEAMADAIIKALGHHEGGTVPA
jgi:hypothetical protein